MNKKILLTISLAFCGYSTYVKPYYNNLKHLTKQEKVVPLDLDSINWNRLISAIIYVESKNDSMAIGTKNSIGCLQITPIYIAQVNKLLDKKKYRLKDRFNKRRSIEIFNLYQEHFNPEKDIDLAIKLHNPRASHLYRDSIMCKYNEIKLPNNKNNNNICKK